MFKTLKGVSINGGPPGLAFGGGIYGISCDIATSNTPTKITVNIVSENGEYNLPELNVASSGASTIEISSSECRSSDESDESSKPDCIVFYNMYPFKYDTNFTASSKTLSVTYIDHSVAFDKIFIGLINRHSQLTQTIPTTFSGSIIECLQCDSLFPLIQLKPGDQTRFLQTSFNQGGDIYVNGPGGINGGFVIMGSEQWVENDCEIPKVEYSFQELCLVLKNLGYEHNLMQFNRSPVYKTPYTGTLREVLSAWAADFSFSFVIDSQEPNLNIFGTDLTQPVNLSPVKKALKEGFSSTSNGGLIRSQSESHSLENTYAQNFILKNIKPAQTFSREQITYINHRQGIDGVIGKVLSITDAVGTEAVHLGRDQYELDVSIALAKYNPEARIIWLSGITAAKGPSGSSWPALGFLPIPNIQHLMTDSVKTQILSSLGESDSRGLSDHPVWQNPENYDVFLGVWSEEFQKKILEKDAELADFYGKWGYWYGRKYNYVTNLRTDQIGICNPPPLRKFCPSFEADWTGKRNTYSDQTTEYTTNPESKPYKRGSYPFQNILTASKGVFHLHGINPATGQPYGAQAHIPGQPEGDYIFAIEENAWGTHQENIDRLFGVRYVLDPSNQPNYTNAGPNLQSGLNNFLPIYSAFDKDNHIQNELRQIFPNYDQNIVNLFDKRTGYFPGVAVIPKLDKMMMLDPLTNTSQKVLEISPMRMYVNALVQQNTQKRRMASYGNNQNECKLWCEKDAVSEACACNPNPETLPEFSHDLAKAFTIYHMGYSATIIFPLEADYKGYWKVKTIFKGTYPKMVEIKGTPSFSGEIGNVMATRVVDVDVTQDVDPLLQNNKYVQKYAITGTQFIDFETYYNHLKNINQFSKFEGETISVKIDGTTFDTLLSEGLLLPEKGLTGFSITMDGEGMSTDLTYSNRPPELPKQEVLLQKLGPQALQGKLLRRSIRTSPIIGGAMLPFNP